MKIKEHEYVRQTLERYTNCRLKDFCDHVLITNFKSYILRFQEKTKGILINTGIPSKDS
jgi:AMP nucleosidase